MSCKLARSYSPGSLRVRLQSEFQTVLERPLSLFSCIHYRLDFEFKRLMKGPKPLGECKNDGELVKKTFAGEGGG